MKSTLKKFISLTISIVIVFVIASLTANSSTLFTNSIKSGAVYVQTDEKLKKITVIPTDTDNITLDNLSNAADGNIELPNGESIKNSAEVIIDRERYLLIIKGDVVPDGKITAGDARAILRISARLDNAGDTVREAADLDSDGKITTSEARDVLRFIAKLTDRLFNYSEDEFTSTEKVTESVKDETDSLPSLTHTEKSTAEETEYEKTSDEHRAENTTAEIETLKKTEPTAEVTTEKQIETTADVTTEKRPEMTSEITTIKHTETTSETTTEKRPETTAEISTQKQTEPSAESTTVKKSEPTAEASSENLTEAASETVAEKKQETTSEASLTTESASIRDSENTSFSYEEESSTSENENNKIIWVALGDSKTDFDNNGVSRPDNYPYWIVKRNPQLELVNLGSAGGMITNERVKNAGDTEILYPSMYKKATEINVKPDIITVAGGFNDWNWSVPLGEFTTDISSYDTSAEANIANSGNTLPFKNTFYMGVFRLAQYLKTEYPDTPVLWITPCPTAVKNYGGPNGYDVNQPLSAYVQAIKDVCEYFSIPVCDMSAETTVPYYTPEDLKNYWRNSDGIHPNGKASEIYSKKIEEYMKNVYESYGYKWDLK